ncbi:hypothetical protein E2C01_006724 [Portunus trituberculatus]|uniref:Uncharacterized protein n=1 Tax=Portunus trituberculatus TaxID=210409 RepID=A0A5B7CX33_PORTR|nr:hypothetical protein [Portunus trituberculatus]
MPQHKGVNGWRNEWRPHMRRVWHSSVCVGGDSDLCGVDPSLPPPPHPPPPSLRRAGLTREATRYMYVKFEVGLPCANLTTLVDSGFAKDITAARVSERTVPERASPPPLSATWPACGRSGDASNFFSALESLLHTCIPSSNHHRLRHPPDPIPAGKLVSCIMS